MTLLDYRPAREYSGSIVTYDDFMAPILAVRRGELPPWFESWRRRPGSTGRMERFLRQALNECGSVARAYSLPGIPGQQFPNRWTHRAAWAAALRIEGYTSNCRPARRTSQAATIYRGGPRDRQCGLSWTLDLDVAAHYASMERGAGGKLSRARRPEDGEVWQATVPPGALLADLVTLGACGITGVEVLVSPSAPEIADAAPVPRDEWVAALDWVHAATLTPRC